MSNRTPPKFPHAQPCAAMCDGCLTIALEFALAPVAEYLAEQKLERWSITARRARPAND